MGCLIKLLSDISFGIYVVIIDNLWGCTAIPYLYLCNDLSLLNYRSSCFYLFSSFMACGVISWNMVINMNFEFLDGKL